VSNLAYLLLGLLGAAALVGGMVVALLAARGVQDGFEDQEGFHSGQMPGTPAADPVMPAGDNQP